MAAEGAVMTLLQSGDHVVVTDNTYGGTYRLFERVLRKYQLDFTYVDSSNTSAIAAAIGAQTKMLFLETPTNPTLELIDIEAVAAVARGANARLVVDNVFATALYQNPRDLGADVVVYSATKHIDGQGRCLGGVVLADEDFVNGPMTVYLRQTGPSLSPFNAWLLLKGLETFPLRVERSSQSAAGIADWLAGHGKVRRVLYPGRADHPQAELARRQMRAGGTMIAFEVDGGKAEAFRLADALRIILISNNLGDTKSLITHPATTTHQRLTPEARAELGISDGMLRLSIGLEDSHDLIADLDSALAAV
jgi:O-succinylhomoserine sulfhydrylase